LKLVGIAVVAFVAIIAAVFVLKDTGMLTGGSATSKVSPVNLAIAEQPAPAPKPGLFGLSVGKTSAAFYRSYLEEQVICQAKAAGIRGVVEKIDLSNTVDVVGNIYTSSNLGGAQKALKLCAGYYARSVKRRLSLSAVGVDSAIVSYVDQITAFDQQAQDAYEAYSLDPASRSPRLVAIGAQREAFYRESEPALIAAFESKYGIKLPSRKEILEEQSKSALASSARFPVDNGPRKLADTLVGVSLTNTMDGGKWTVEQGEFIDGKVIKATPSVGGCFIEVEMAFRGIRSGRGCKVHAYLIAAEDPVLNMFWIYYASDAR
ncbi:MAG: hypothetical protein RL495_1211, partial [Verrucomicrobiota bacterium]